MNNSVHKVVLSSASKYVYDFFKLNTEREKRDDKDIITVPDVIQSVFCSSDPKACLLIVLKYCYSNQSYEAIQEEVTDDNIYSILQFAHCLNVMSLIVHLEKRIVNSLVKHDNGISLLKEAIMVRLIMC